MKCLYMGRFCTNKVTLFLVFFLYFRLNCNIEFLGVVLLYKTELKAFNHLGCVLSSGKAGLVTVFLVVFIFWCHFIGENNTFTYL